MMNDREARIQKVEKFYEKAKENFYIDRNKNIEEINKFAEGIAELDPSYIDFEYPELTPENLLPSLFAEEFDEVQYEVERKALLELYAKFEAIQDTLITEAERLAGM